MSSSILYKKFFALLRYSLGIDDSFVYRLSAEEWAWMREEAIRQALVGVLYMGVKKLPDDLRPPRLLLMQWAFDAENIRGTNQTVNEVAARLTRMFKERGRDSVILKGPANALLYPDPFARSCGDVDIMLPGGRDSVVKLLTEMELMEGAEMEFHHVGLPEEKFGVSVEVHYASGRAFSPIKNRRLQKFMKKEFANWNATAAGFFVPSPKYAMVMQLWHIKHHFYSVGIGLRQLIDYYFVLRSSTEDERREINGLLNSFGLLRMAQALMWFLVKVLHMDVSLTLCKPNERRGRMLLNVALNGGNFGSFGEIAGAPLLKRLLIHYSRIPWLMKFDFTEVLWKELFWPKEALPMALHLCRR